MNVYPLVKVKHGPMFVTAQLAPYSFSLDRLVVHVGELTVTGSQGRDTVSVTLDIGFDDLKNDQHVVQVLTAAAEGIKCATVACAQCGTHRLDVPDSNRYAALKGKSMLSDKGMDKTKPLCEMCFSQAMRVEFDKGQEKRKQAASKYEAGLKGRGFTHKLVVCVHPAAGGDDFIKTLYTVGVPSPRVIKNALRGSAVKDDYKVSTL